MFKRLIEETTMTQRASPLGRPSSPYRPRGYDPLITPKSRVDRSPIRSQPQQLYHVKNFLNDQLLKGRTATPHRSKSPLRGFDQQKPTQQLYRKTSQGCQSPYKSRPFVDCFRQNPFSYGGYRQQESSRTYYPNETEREKENRKQNCQLFKQLIGGINIQKVQQPEPIPATPITTSITAATSPVARPAKPELKQFAQLLKHKSTQSKKPQTIVRAYSTVQQSIKEESLLISNQKNPEPVKDTVTQTAVNREQATVFSLGMQSKVQMVESVRPPPPLILLNQEVRRSGESSTLQDRVNESHEASVLDMSADLDMNPCF